MTLRTLSQFRPYKGVHFAIGGYSTPLKEHRENPVIGLLMLTVKFRDIPAHNVSSSSLHEALDEVLCIFVFMSKPPHIHRMQMHGLSFLPQL